MYKIENIMFSEVAGDSPPPPHFWWIAPQQIAPWKIVPWRSAHWYNFTSENCLPVHFPPSAATAIKSCSNIRLLLSFIFQRLEKDQNLGLQI